MAVKQTISRPSETAPRTPPKRSVTRRRSIPLYLLLSVVTLSLYHFWFMQRWVKDLNTVCDGDGENTPGVGIMLLLWLPTLGIYPLLWMAGVADRMYNNADRYDADISRDGESFFLWVMLLPVAGFFIAMALAIRDMNCLTEAYVQGKNVQPTAAKPAAEKTPQALPVKKSPQETFPTQKKQGGLIGLTGSCAGMRIPLRAGETIRMGRDTQQVAVVVLGEKISRVHCTIQYNGEQLGYCIVDLSRNGVFLEGKKIRSGEMTHANAGAVIALADGANKFQLL